MMNVRARLQARVRVRSSTRAKCITLQLQGVGGEGWVKITEFSKFVNNDGEKSSPMLIWKN
jgi:hypothetical protein